jgi:peptide-methionine (S)-S-oxide reductase
MEHIPGVTAAVSGYTGGTARNPTYEQVGGETTGHVEAVRVTFDSTRISYRQLVDRFWRTIDPTDPDGVFCDRGPNYHTAVFATAAQTEAATASRPAAQAALGRRFVTPVRAAARFWPAGREHQDYAETHPVQYEAYRVGCRRTESLRRVWGAAAVS